MFEELVGKKIRIISLKDEPNEDYYIGLDGIVTSSGVDPWGDGFIHGTWGGISIYPEYDDFEILEN